jgi:hypothetical protein
MCSGRRAVVRLEEFAEPVAAFHRTRRELPEDGRPLGIASGHVALGVVCSGAPGEESAVTHRLQVWCWALVLGPVLAPGARADELVRNGTFEQGNKEL